MASLDAFEITLTGKSCHAAMPERGADPIVAAAQLIMALQNHSVAPPVAAGIHGGKHYPDFRRGGDQRAAG
ncbi:N-acyl-L-amino acid amidohydrolase [Klebsiella michiganensis]|uniref:N-acyl-L-amino acid amidohydrolase n=1 Tax=Klebsiella michiganensis TaxID=1134687 RepID=A0A7H4PLC4_9ENTR|nr:N-acyl-L-amino acid amidohydrolase [Klebsiella michiganensis]